MARKSIAKWFPAFRATPKPNISWGSMITPFSICILQWHVQQKPAVLTFQSWHSEDEEFGSSGNICLLFWGAWLASCPERHVVLSFSWFCASPSGKYWDVLRSLATVLNMLHVGALKEYLNLCNKTNICTCYIHVHMLVLLHNQVLASVVSFHIFSDSLFIYSNVSGFPNTPSVL